MRVRNTYHEEGLPHVRSVRIIFVEFSSHYTHAVNQLIKAEYQSVGYRNKMQILNVFYLSCNLKKPQFMVSFEEGLKPKILHFLQLCFVSNKQM